MPPSLATLLWFIFLLLLLRFDPSKVPDTSPALWVPTIWIFFTASRLPSQWLGGSVGTAAQALEEGNPLDRLIFSSLILLSVVILALRPFAWGRFFERNFALFALLSFALVSVVWSDFPFVAIKRWIRDLGDYLVIFVVLSDPRPTQAITTVLRRLCYLLIPLSILLIKYYPQIGMQYSIWTGAKMYVGPTTGKNMLGVLCLVSGIFFFWHAVTNWHDRKNRNTRNILMVDAAFIWMTLWLLNYASSATSTVCLTMGCLVILAARSRLSQRHPGFLKFMAPAAFCLYLILAFGFDINGDLAGAVGRDPTLTGRSNIWNAVLSTHTNPIVGAGYESFWLGERLNQVWRVAGRINEAHNGYLEVYLNLGFIGVFLLVSFMIASYRIICKRISPSFSLASLSLAMWTIILFYNMTESAAFKGQFVWLIFVLVVVDIPTRTQPAHHSLFAENRQAAGQNPHRANPLSPGIDVTGAAAIATSIGVKLPLSQGKWQS
jgi:exopolysaccharide production protein ExoQ